MRWFVLGWKMLGLERSLGSCIVTYADDLVPEQGRGGARPDARAHGQAEADGQQKRRAPQDFAAQLNRLGFRDVIHLSPAEATARYFAGRHDGLRAPCLAQQRTECRLLALLCHQVARCPKPARTDMEAD